ncbi:MAG TPA: carboxymuconolactone decarboxylase family protein [Acidobacteriaceae bacterium]
MDRKLKYPRVSPEPYEKQSALEHYLRAESGLEQTLLNFVRLRASLLNGCHFCIDLHTWELKKSNETPDRIASLADWRDTTLYTQRERAALAWTEAVTNIQDGHVPDVIFDEVSQHFTEKELVDLTWAVASINAWNRMGITFQPQFHEPIAK